MITTRQGTGTQVPSRTPDLHAAVKMAASFESLKIVALTDTAFDRYVSRNHSDIHEIEKCS